MNPQTFFEEARKTVFRGVVHPHQVEGCNAIFAAWNGSSDARQIAYVLATAYHETAFTMQPISEYGKGRGHSYGAINPNTGHAYYGRGLVQLTWIYNYRDMSPVVGSDLVHNPDAALELPIAAKIICYGMDHGSFTGRKLSDFFDKDKADWINARTIINGHDRAEQIAEYGHQFHAALVAAQ